MIVSDYLQDNESIVQQLRSIPALNELRDKDLRGILKMSRVIKYEPEELIIKEGQYDQWIYFLISGKVRILKKGETLSILKRKGDMFGEMGIIDGSPRSASIVAIEETACLAVDASYMDRLKGEDKTAFNAVLYRVFAEILASRLRIADQNLVALKEENSELRNKIKELETN